MSRNLYYYGNDNPILYSDPEGRDAVLHDDARIFRNPYEKGSGFLLTKGKECYIQFRVKRKGGWWYYISVDIDKPKRQTKIGYVHEDSIDVDENEIDALSAVQDLSFLNEDEQGYGSRGPQVYCLQYILYTHGYLPSLSDCDGRYGEDTHDAVAEFQRCYACYLGEYKGAEFRIDGFFGPQTRAAIEDCVKNNLWGILEHWRNN